MTNPFIKSVEEVDSLLDKARKVAKGKTLAEAEIDPAWLRTYARIARRSRDDREFGLTRYPYEAGPSVGAFVGGFFEHKDWPLRRGLEGHQSMRAVMEYESNYINSAGFWMAFHEAAIVLRQEALTAQEEEEAIKCDVWALISIRYGLRVVGLRSEFYKMASKDPVYAKMVMPTLEGRNDMAASEDLTEPLDTLSSHMTTQLMKAVATLSASNATKRSRGKGGSAGDQ